MEVDTAHGVAGGTEESRDGTEADMACSPGESGMESCDGDQDMCGDVSGEDIEKVKSSKAYSLRNSSIINRIQTERRQQQPKKPKPKVKPAPLSKYRRRTANSRERDRMKEINDAFQVLRAVIPNYPAPTGKNANTNKQTKITTLRLAMNYIAALSDMLAGEEPGVMRPSSTSSSQAYSSSEASLSPAQLRLDSEGESIIL